MSIKTFFSKLKKDKDGATEDFEFVSISDVEEIEDEEFDKLEEEESSEEEETVEETSEEEQIVEETSEETSEEEQIVEETSEEEEDSEEVEETLEDASEEISEEEETCGFEIDILEDEDVEEKEEKHTGKLVLKILGIILAVVLGIYLIITAVFTQVFFYGTYIDGQEYSLQQIKDVEAYQAKQVEAYELVLDTIDGRTETISGSDIGLMYIQQEEIKSILNAQNPFMWPEMFFTTYEYGTTISVEYDETLLIEVVENLDCMNEDSMVEPTDAYPEFQDTEYVIVGYELGTLINEEAFYTAVIEKINTFTSELNLEEENCYATPDITEETQTLIDLTAELNETLTTTITYEEGVEVDEATLASWIVIEDDNSITFDEDKIVEFVADLADQFNTVGTTRTFTAADGATAEVSGGSFGWTVDTDEEFTQILLDISGNEAVEREISYSKRGVSHDEMDWGNTYTEIDLTDQKVYYILDGEVVVEGSIVTGDVSDGNATPQGVYSLTYKTTNAVLRGTQYADGTYAYESPVSYWMPFNGGIGMHDASWRSTFGGTIYQTNGSHGCVNMNYSTAQAIYSYISAGDPIICHY